LTESHHDLISLFEHDLFGKPVSTFPDHALDGRAISARLAAIGMRAGSHPQLERYHIAVQGSAARFRAQLAPRRTWEAGKCCIAKI
jgi:hypothetical protein